MLKPDTVRRGKIGEIIRRIEDKGFTIIAMKMLTPSRNLAEEHYAVHRNKDFFEPTCDFVCSGNVVAMVVEGLNAVGLMRILMGKAKPVEALPGTIRGDLTADIQENLIHGSDSYESAKIEIALWFPELVNT